MSLMHKVVDKVAGSALVKPLLETNESKIGPKLTDGAGHPVDDDFNSLVVGPNGPVLLQDVHLLDKMAHFDRERVPERVVHAKGAGAHGYFEVTHDITNLCKAQVFSSVGKQTPVFVRFSVVNAESGGPDTKRDPRGFAIKHYTEDGIWDMVANNTPVFFIRDPIQFPDFIHSQRRNPQTNLLDHNAYWDFLSRTPESIHMLTMNFTDRGTPASYRHMHGFGNHTFKLVNSEGQVHFVKFHYISNQGIKTLTDEEARQLAGEEADLATKDLYQSIEKGDYPSWTVNIQVMTLEQAQTYKWNILDITKVWPHGDFPLIPVGKLVLNKNPTNFFAEVEQSAFCPANMVPGIEASADRMLAARLFSYADTQRYRVGPNYFQVPINCPYRTKVANYQRNGFMTVNDNGGAMSTYNNNSTPMAPGITPEARASPFTVNGEVGRWPLAKVTDDDFEQCRTLYQKVLSDTDRDHLIHNIVGFLSPVSRPDIIDRMLGIFGKVDPSYEQRVRAGLQAMKTKDA